jgi:hypothetical protein
MAILVTAIVAGSTGCDKSEPPASRGTPDDAARSSALSEGSAPGAEQAARDATAGSPLARRAWSGTYKTTAGTLYVPDEWKVRWHADDATTGIGDGHISVAVDTSNGGVRGEMDGPLGPALVDGYLADGGLSATIRRRDPHDHGFTGVLLGQETSARIEGTLNVSPATGGAVRGGTFTLGASDATEH